MKCTNKFFCYYWIKIQFHSIFKRQNSNYQLNTLNSTLFLDLQILLYGLLSRIFHKNRIVMISINDGYKKVGKIVDCPTSELSINVNMYVIQKELDIYFSFFGSNPHRINLDREKALITKYKW